MPCDSKDWGTPRFIEWKLELVTQEKLPRSFYDRDTLKVARDVLGCRLVLISNGKRISGIIIESEAYCGETDLGCHAKAGRTKRTSVMYGPPGFSFVYFTYGNHWMFCAVTQAIDQPDAILIRGIIPTEGIDKIEERRGKQARKKWTDGPGKLTQALGISGEHNNLDLTQNDSKLFIEKGIKIPDKFVTTSPRIGLYTVPEPWKSIPWRFLAKLPENWLRKNLLEDYL